MNGNSFGRLFQLTTFGESHGEAMGCIVSGCPAGLEISEEEIQKELDRRKPGQSDVTTPRNEPDRVKILSGVKDGYTTGTPIGMQIQNKDEHSSDYSEFVTAPRPSHGDYTYSAKFGTRSPGGGGRSSQRETVNWVAAGAIARKILNQHGIEITAHTNQIDDIKSPELDFDTIKENVDDNKMRCAHPETADKMIERVEKYREEGKTIGGSVYFEAKGVPPGLGAPRFDGLPARLGKVMMGTHAVSAFEFGLGKEAREIKARERNDEFGLNEEGKVEPLGNDSGGLQGGISNGNPIYGEVTIHAPTSTGEKQQTVDWEKGEEKTIQVGGRHDPVLPPRHVPIIEANLALTLVDFMLLSGRINPDRLDDQPGEYDTDYHPNEV